MTKPEHITVRAVGEAIEKIAPASWQEDFDNTGWQIVYPDDAVSGVLTCVDVTERIADEAAARGCNLIVSHHPLLFRGLKQIAPGQGGRIPAVVERLIKNRISLYSCHTSLDSAPAPYGLSFAMARRIGLSGTAPLTTSPGLGAIGSLPTPATPDEFAAILKRAFPETIVRYSRAPSRISRIETVGLCAGSGIEFAEAAILKGAQAFVTSDVKLNWFLDLAERIVIFDIGHHDAERESRKILASIIGDAFPELKVAAADEPNPIIYI